MSGVAIINTRITAMASAAPPADPRTITVYPAGCLLAAEPVSEIRGPMNGNSVKALDVASNFSVVSLLSGSPGRFYVRLLL